VGLIFNKIRYEARGESYLGVYYTTLRPDGSVAPLRQVAGPDVEISSFLSLTNGDLLLGGGLGDMFAFDPEGPPRWKRSFGHPLLENFASTNLSGGSVCVSAWTETRQDLPYKLRIMQLDQRGRVLHVADIDALRGQVAAGPDGSCAVLYDRAPGAKGEYRLTVLDRSFTRQWTAPVPQSTASGAEFSLVPLADGYLAQISEVFVEFDWSGEELWNDAQYQGPLPVQPIVVAAKEGFFLVNKGVDMNNGFHVKRATSTHQ
jgi:hypothetical protein